MKKHKKLKDEFSKKDSKRKQKNIDQNKRRTLNHSDYQPPKYRFTYQNEEE